MKVAFIILLTLFVKSVLLYRIYRLVPVMELKRRARSDKSAAAIYKVAATGSSLDAFLWLIGTSAAAGVLIMAALTEWWLAAILIVLMSWLIIFGPLPRESGWLWKLTAFKAPYFFKLVSFLQPLLRPLGDLLIRLPAAHSRLYEKEDLLQLLRRQNRQADNRLGGDDLKVVLGALTFGDKQVGDIMTPRRTVRFVSEDETIGPMLMDELHATGFSRFPVIKGSVKAPSPGVSGTLFLKDLVDNPHQAKIREVMKGDVYFINETCTLLQALDAFLKSRHHLLIVVNNFEELVGVISLEDVLEQIIGSEIVDEFDKYADLRAVAGLEAKKDQKRHEETVPKPPAS